MEQNSDSDKHYFLLVIGVWESRPNPIGIGIGGFGRSKPKYFQQGTKKKERHSAPLRGRISIRKMLGVR